MSSLSDPALRPYLPLLYVAWSDGVLAAVEQAALQQHIETHVWLTPQQRQQLWRWLDPARPPDPQALASLRQTLESAAKTMRPEKRLTLARLGLEMSQTRGANSPTQQSLETLEAILGLVGDEAAAQFTASPKAAPSTGTAAASPLQASAIQRLLDAPPGCQPEEPAVRDRVRELLSDPSHRALDLSRGEYRSHVLAWTQKLADAGIGGYAFPGVVAQTDSLASFLVAFETLGYGDLSVLVKVGVQFGLFGGSIFFLGSDAQRETYLPKVASMELPGCFAMSEVGHGSNVMALETQARYDHATRELVIHTPAESARKEWIGNAALHGRMATVFAQLQVGDLDHGVHAVLVPIRDAQGTILPGVRVGDNGPKMGLEGVDNGRLWFEHVRVPVGNLLGRFARIDETGAYQSPIASPNKRFFTMLGTLVGGRLSVASGALSGAKVGMAIAIRYGEARRQFGPEDGSEVPLMAYPTHQQRLLPRLAGLYAMHFGVAAGRRAYLEAQAADDEESAAKVREVEVLAAGLKAYLTAHSTDTLRECREACGGQGYLQVNRIAGLMNDTEVYKTFEGDNTVLLQLVAKGILTEYQSHFSEARLWATTQLLTQQLAAAVRKRVPDNKRTRRAELADRGWHKRLMHERRTSLTSSATLRLKKRLDQDMDSFAALLEVQDHLVALARAFVEEHIRDCFEEAIDTQTDAESVAALDRLLTLWTLWRLQMDAAWFLENGFFESGQLKAIRKEVQQLCLEVRADDLPLVNAFGIPDEALAAPIAFGDPAKW